MRSLLLIVYLLGIFAALCCANTLVGDRKTASGLCDPSLSEYRCKSGVYACFSTSVARCCNCDAAANVCYGCLSSLSCSGKGATTTCKVRFPIIAVILPVVSTFDENARIRCRLRNVTSSAPPFLTDKMPHSSAIVVPIIVILIVLVICCRRHTAGAQNQGGVASTSMVVISTPGPEAVEMQPQQVYVEEKEPMFAAQPPVVYSQPQYSDGAAQQAVYTQPQLPDRTSPYLEEGHQPVAYYQ